MGTTIGYDTIHTLLDHGVIAAKRPSEPRPTLPALFAAVAERGWVVTIAPFDDGGLGGDDKPREPFVTVEVHTGVAGYGVRGKPLLAALAEATADALDGAA